MSEKICTVCGESKPLADFYKMAGMRDGHRNECKACNLVAKRRRYEADPAKYIAMVARWQKANPERVRETRRRRNAHPERQRKQRDSYYRRTYGISADEFDALLEKQDGGCAICGRKPERDPSFHLDHDHLTGEIRGILCLSCNQGVGQFQDDPGLLERAAAYIREGRAPAVG